MQSFLWKLQITSRRPRNTLNPSTNSKMISTKLAETIIKSKIFQPQRKKSLDSAINLIMHSNANMDVKTCNGNVYRDLIDSNVEPSPLHTLFPISKACRMFSLIPWCSSAKNNVFSTMHNVIPNSNRGSRTICEWVKISENAINYSHPVAN